MVLSAKIIPIRKQLVPQKRETFFIDSEEDVLVVQVEGEKILLETWKERETQQLYNQGYEDATYHWIIILIISLSIVMQLYFVTFYYTLPEPYPEIPGLTGKDSYKFLEFYLNNDLKNLP